jgi:aldehyde:ferredoxin oxidoreductase
MHGYTGKILRVDLSSATISKEDLPSYLIEYIGGTGFAARLLFDEVARGVDPLSAANKCVIATGPLSATMFSQGGRYMMAAKSPLTGVWGESHCGGYFGPEIKYSGYDMIILEGESKKPVYLVIKDDDVRLKNAEHLWGKPTDQTTEIICRDEEVEEVACIGPAGENLVLFSAIITDKSRAAARSGLGAVWGKKRLKAIAARGTKDVTVFDVPKFKELCKQAYWRYIEGPEAINLEPLRDYGTPNLVEVHNSIGHLPTKNHKKGVFDQADRIGSEVFRSKYRLARHSCFGCKVQCKYASHSGRHGSFGEGPEYESIVLLGSDCMVSDPEDLIYANHLCNTLGLDTISCGNTIAFAMECHETGLVEEEIRWGDGNKLIDLVQKIAQRQGIGDLLAQGVRKAAAQIGGGADKLAMHVKGQECSAQDGRAHKSSGLMFATSVRGADHLRGLVCIDLIGYPDVARKRYDEEYIPAAIDKLTEEFKGTMVYDVERFFAVVDSLIMCKYGTMYPLIYWWSDFPDILYATTGIDYFRNQDNLMRSGDKICLLRRAFNQREGLSRKDDTLPHRMLNELEEEGPAKGQVCDLKVMLEEYYNLWGMDENGLIKPQRLDEVGLGDVRQELYQTEK